MGSIMCTGNAAAIYSCIIFVSAPIVSCQHPQLRRRRILHVESGLDPDLCN